MRLLMDQVFDRYGSNAVLTSQAGVKHLKVFFHSVNSRSWQNMERMFSPLGEIPRGQYICILPIAGGAKAGDQLEVMDKIYILRRVEEMFAQGQGIYCWSLCVEKGGENTWGISE